MSSSSKLGGGVALRGVTPVGIILTILLAAAGAALFGSVVWLTCWGMCIRSVGSGLAWSVLILASLCGAIYGAKWGARFARRLDDRELPPADD